ncbi:hypothetical protein AAG906_010431 [Vitis piasezkii]
MTTHQVQDPTIIHFTIDGRHGILGARHIAEALLWTHPAQSDIVHILSKGASSRQYILRKELPPSMFFIEALPRHNIFPLQHWVQRRGVLLEALFRISEGYFFGPHHLIMVALLYFEEKILEHLGYPEEPQLERKCICREIFTLDKWTSMTAYGADQGAPAGPEHPEIPHPEQPEEPQLVEIPADMRAPAHAAPAVASPEPSPEVAPSAPQATPRTPPCSSGADYRHSNPAHYHPKADSASSGHQSNTSNGAQFEVEMKELESLESNHTKLKANFAGCEISLWLRNHKRMAAKSAFGCEMVSFRLQNFAAILHTYEILLSASDICDRHF